MVKRFPTLVSMMFETLEASDLAVMGTGMETLGFIATTLKGKYMLQSQGNLLFDCIHFLFLLSPLNTNY